MLGAGGVPQTVIPKEETRKCIGLLRMWCLVEIAAVALGLSLVAVCCLCLDYLGLGVVLGPVLGLVGPLLGPVESPLLPLVLVL